MRSYHVVGDLTPHANLGGAVTTVAWEDDSILEWLLIQVIHDTVDLTQLRGHRG